MNVHIKPLQTKVSATVFLCPFFLFKLRNRSQCTIGTIFSPKAPVNIHAFKLYKNKWAKCLEVLTEFCRFAKSYLITLNSFMKKLTLTLVTFLLFSSFALENSSTTVYICTGPKAKLYHSSSTCRGMNRCSGEVVGVNLAKAEKMGRRECKICW
jgi:hypothetical protein